MAAANAHSEPARKVTSVVRADPRTGRLVRSMVVVGRPVPRKTDAVVAAEATIEQLVERTAKAYEVDPALVHSIIKVESNYNTYAISNKGAQGLMQLIPSTAQRMGVKDSFDPKDNIEGGVRYLKYLQSLFGDDRLAIAAYNAGEAAVAKYNFQVPPYPETMNYVYQVGRHWGEAAKRRQTEAVKEAAAAEPAAPAGPVYPRLEQVRDEQGRVYLRTAGN